ncbi:class C sortase [Arthrobacter sp. MYb227]|nr:class C sortase [Arthrobacter sp. MYb227]
MLGIGMLLYTQAADWFSTRNHNEQVSGYIDSVDDLDDEARQHALDLANEYNKRMPQGPLRDPYTASSDPQGDAEATEAYKQLLSVSDDGVIGQVLYPRLDISLPVYHGTADEVLRKGVGHIFGSSLPVGGPSTRSVLTSHSGLVNASLFTPLLKAEIGDIFTVQVLGDKHWYQVNKIDTVLPEDTSSLAIVDNQDYVTLITCSPLGINTHRLLVHGVRISPPDTAEFNNVIDGDGKTEGFPWWVALFLGGAAAVGWILFAPPRKQILDSEEVDETPVDSDQESVSKR